MTVEIFSDRFIHVMNPKLHRSDSSRSDSSSEFDFPMCTNPNQEFSHADELFSDGKILPFGIKNQFPDSRQIQVYREFKSSEKQSFDKNSLKVKRSRSLSCGSHLFPLSLLSRSKSEGSPRNSKSSQLVWENKDKDNSQKKKKKDLQKTNSYQRRPSRTSSGQMNPVLNVPLADMFCIGSFFSTGKDHTNKGK